MPETVLGVLEKVTEVLGRGVEALFVKHRRKRHLHVEVVLVESVGHHIGSPLAHLVFGNDPLVVDELRGIAVGDTDHLASPSSLDPVLQFLQRNRELVVRR